MEISWLSLLPPIIVMIIALYTHNINLALIISIFSGCFIAKQGVLADSISMMISHCWEQGIDIQKWYLYLFLINTATFTILFESTGCAAYLAHLATQHTTSRKAIQTSSLLISTFLFLDDYLSILTTGFIITPLATHFAIAREKIAFLVHSMAGPIVILAPISSWLATIITYLKESGVDQSIEAGTRIISDPFYLYLHTIPFIFYGIITVASVWFIVRNGISFGPMAAYEAAAQKTPHPAITNSYNPLNNQHGALGDLLIPMAILIGGIVTGILYSGNYYVFGGTHSFMEAIQKSNQLFLTMCIASTLALIVSMTRALASKKISARQIIPLALSGFGVMKSAICMVFLASVLGYLLKNDLQTGPYLAHHLLNHIPYSLMPLVFFLVAMLVTLSTGSSWATFAILLPIAIPMITSLTAIQLPTTPDTIPVLFPLLGAIFSGAVMGDHLSPVSETTIMAATCTKTDPITHAYTQFIYTVPSILGSLVAFTITGFLLSYPSWANCLISICSGLVVSWSLLLSSAPLYKRIKKNSTQPGI